MGRALDYTRTTADRLEKVDRVVGVFKVKVLRKPLPLFPVRRRSRCYVCPVRSCERLYGARAGDTPLSPETGATLSRNGERREPKRTARFASLGRFPFVPFQSPKRDAVLIVIVTFYVGNRVNSLALANSPPVTHRNDRLKRKHYRHEPIVSLMRRVFLSFFSCLPCSPTGDSAPDSGRDK